LRLRSITLVIFLFFLDILEDSRAEI